MSPFPSRRAAVAAAVALASALASASCGPASRPAARSASRPLPEAALTSASTVAAAANAGAAVPVAASPTKDGRGFWVASTDGSVTPEGDAVSHGDAHSAPLAAPIVDVATTATGGGYWLLGADGGVFTFGDARFYGSTGNDRLNQPALQLVATPTGHGYWFVARDGGVFTFGDARFHGSTGDMRLNKPIVGMAATRDGGGYWLVARDGGIFAFGDARFLGSTGNVRLASPVVAMAATRDGGGYWLVARDGGIFAFGDARFHGSAASSRPPTPAVGLVATGDGGGYWIVLGNGQVRAFGDAAAIATRPVPSVGFSLVGQMVTIDPGHNGGNAGDPSYINRLVWNGREYETCDTTGTATDAGYTEAAFNFDVGTRLAAILRSFGAAVVMTRTTNTGVGPCVDQRAFIANRARSDAAVFIHADGGPPGGRGFTILLPVADGPNDAVISSSQQLGVAVRAAFEAGTGEPTSNYDGVNGFQPRDDLAGLNLTRVSKVLIECANMRNATDAGLVTSATWRQEAAGSLARGLSQYLIGYP